MQTTTESKSKSKSGRTLHLGARVRTPDGTGTVVGIESCVSVRVLIDGERTWCYWQMSQLTRI